MVDVRVERLAGVSTGVFTALVDASLELSAELSLLELRAGGVFGDADDVDETRGVSVAVESSAAGTFFRIEAGRSEWTVSTTVGAAGVVDVPAALFSRLILAISSSSET